MWGKNTILFKVKRRHHKFIKSKQNQNKYETYLIRRFRLWILILKITNIKAQADSIVDVDIRITNIILVKLVSRDYVKLALYSCYLICYSFIDF